MARARKQVGSSLPVRRVTPDVTAHHDANGLDEGLIRRLRIALDGQTNEHVAEWSGVSAESIRRYLHGDAPSAKFLMAVCTHEGLSGHWLLRGEGPPKLDHMCHVAIRSCPLPELFAEVGRRLEKQELLGHESDSKASGPTGGTDSVSMPFGARYRSA